MIIVIMVIKMSVAIIMIMVTVIIIRIAKSDENVRNEQPSFNNSKLP